MPVRGMVAFGQKLQGARLAGWEGYYIEYNGLKGEIREIRKLLDEGKKGDSDEIRSCANQFATSIDFNVNRAVAFYLENVQEALRSLAAVRTKWPFLGPTTLPQLYEQCKEIAVQLKDCILFVELNAEGVRKILKKAEKVLSRRVVCRDEFLRSRLRPDNRKSRLDELRLFKDCDLVIEEIRLLLDHMRMQEVQWLEQSVVDTAYVKRVHERRDTVQIIQDLHAVAHKTIESTKWYYGLLSQAQVDYEAAPVGESTSWGIFLNNYNTFLYMVNYYSVIPTAAAYAESLNMSSTVSGVILAMTPLAALLSSILYSVWSNRSFKQPLLFCTLLLVSGNMLYGSALKYDAPWMLFTGRILVGLGGCRAVNRRYLADFVPVEERTFHSALFVAIGSLGMSVGPGLQPLFDDLDFEVKGFRVNSLTAPGFLMSFLWVVFFVQCALSFREPLRRFAPRGARDLVTPLLVNPQSSIGFQVVNPLADSPSPFFPPNPVMERKREHLIDVDGTVVCLWVYFVLKLVQEAFQTAAPLATHYYFNWPVYYTGYLLALIGLVALPCNILVGWMSFYVDDRVTQLLSLFVLGLGALGAVQFSFFEFTAYQYCAAAVTLFVAAQILEGVNMALLSKVMPKVMSRGLWNSGFLSTEAGTFGRVVGDVIITLSGSFAGVGGVQNLTMIPCAVLVAVSLVFVLWKNKSLTPIGERSGQNEAEQMLESDLWAVLPELRPLSLTGSRSRRVSQSGMGSFSSFRLRSYGPSFAFAAKTLSPAGQLVHPAWLETRGEYETMSTPSQN